MNRKELIASKNSSYKILKTFEETLSKGHMIPRDMHIAAVNNFHDICECISKTDGMKNEDNVDAVMASIIEARTPKPVVKEKFGEKVSKNTVKMLNGLAKACDRGAERLERK